MTKAEQKKFEDELQKLTADLRDARVAGAEALKGLKDGGTSNFDCPTMKVGYGRSKKRNALLTAAVEAAGFRPSPGYGASRGYTMLHGFPGDNFQGSPRTASAEAVSKLLQERGYVTSVHYAMD